MVEADSQLKLLPTSTLDIYKVFDSLTAKSILVGEKLVATYSISM